MTIGVHTPGFEGRIAAGVLSAVNEVFPIAVNHPKPAPQPQVSFFDDKGVPTESALSTFFSSKRKYADKGPVSTAWREWCFAHGMYPEESKDPLAVPGGIVYTFGPCRIFYAHGKATVVAGK